MYYKLILESGHVGAGKSFEAVRYFKAESPVDLFTIAARIPRVKGKDKGTGVKLVQSVSRDEYIQGISKTVRDPYQCTRRRKRGSRKKKDVLFH